MDKKEKIKKLLALAAGSSNPHEAANALRKAQALMREHNVNADLLHMGHSEAESHERPPLYIWRLAYVVGTAFGVRHVFNHGAWRFYGNAVNAELAVYAYDVLIRQLKKARAEFVKTLNKRLLPKNKRKRGDDFCLGWISAVNSKCEAIAISDEENELIDKYAQSIGMEIVKTTHSKRRKVNDSAACAGIKAGKNAVLNAPVNGKELAKLGGW